MAAARAAGSAIEDPVSTFRFVGLDKIVAFHSGSVHGQVHAGSRTIPADGRIPTSASPRIEANLPDAPNGEPIAGVLASVTMRDDSSTVWPADLATSRRYCMNSRRVHRG
jgi:hypothetical protein